MDSKNKSIPIYRLAVLGMMSVGKTSIISRFVNNNFESQYEETNDDIRPFKVLINIAEGDQSQTQHIILTIEDLFGLNHPDLEGDRSQLKKNYLVNIMENLVSENKGLSSALDIKKQIYGYIFVFDVTDLRTLEFLKPFIMHINDNEEKLNKLRTKKMFVGNKTDLLSSREKERLAKNKDIKEIVEKYSSVPHMFCSALEGTGINRIFEEMAKLIVNDVKVGLLENELKDAVKDLLPSKPKESKKEKVKATRSKWQTGFLNSCGIRKNLDESEESENSDESKLDILEQSSIPELTNREEKNCQMF